MAITRGALDSSCVVVLTKLQNSHLLQMRSETHVEVWRLMSCVLNIATMVL